MAEPRARFSPKSLSRPSLRLWLGGGWLALLVIAAVVAGRLAPHDPLAQDLLLQTNPPFWLKGAAPGYLLGADSLGRDMLSRLIYASRPALTLPTTIP